MQARQTIERRVNELGVAEPIIAQQGADQILVQLPGVTDVNRAKDIIGSPGLLELKIVEQGPSAAKETLLVNGQVPPNMELLPGTSGAPGETGATVYYLVRKVAAVTGRDLRNARPVPDQNNRPAVSFTLNTEGARKFGNVTGTEHRPAAGHRPRRAGSVRSHDRRADHDRRTDHGQLHAGGGSESFADSAVGRASGPPDLPAGAHDWPDARRRFDPRGRDGLAGRPRCWS